MGCASTQSRTLDSAEELELRAVAFADATRFPPANEFAAQADRFRQTVTHAAGDQGVVLAYRELWHSYHALQDQVDGSSPPIRAALKPVKRAFIHIQRHMSAYAHADQSILARGGYVLDPYYND
jgi:hypothetical protein